jgi:hypothetical protein
MELAREFRAPILSAARMRRNIGPIRSFSTHSYARRLDPPAGIMPRKPRFGSDSLGFWMEQSAVRPKNGRPLQDLLSTRRNGFVSSVASRAFRDGTGIFMVNRIRSAWFRVGARYFISTFISDTSASRTLRSNVSLVKGFASKEISGSASPACVKPV